MAFFKSFQPTLPSVNISSILDSVTSRVDDLANAVSDATYAVSDQLTEQVTTIINKVQEEEEGENSRSQDAAQASGSQEGRAGNKSMWQMQRNSDAGQAGSKNNQNSDATEGQNSQGQLEWEWRDGCWRVKKTEAELAEEEMRKKEEKEIQEKREQRRKERRERQLEKEAEAKRNREEANGGGMEEEDETSEKTDDRDGQERKTNESEDPISAQQKSDECDKTSYLADSEIETKTSKQQEEKDGEAEEGQEREADNEEEDEPSRSSSKVKKKKSDKKRDKESSKKPEEDLDVEKKKDRSKKSKKKKKGNQDGVVSNSEEEKSLEGVTQQNMTSAWSKGKQSSEQGGYSSEASSEQAASIQRIKKDSSLTELQPPPYQHVSSGTRKSSRSERGVRRPPSPQQSDSPRCSSEASVEQDTESYLNKGCEEDIPSDSTAVLSPEDGSGLQLPSAYEPEPIAQYGTLDVAFEYDSTEQWLAVTVTAATDIPALKQTGNIAWQVHLVLLPTKKQRAKTGVQKGPCPVFTETFKFSRVEQEALGDYAVRFRLYSIRRMKKEKVLGEKVFYLTKLNLQGKIALPVTLEPGSELTGCGSLVSVSRSAGALSYRSTEDSSLPEVLLGLIYNSATGQLSAEVIQGSHFKTAASDKPVNGLFCCVKHFVGGQLYIMRDTYVKLTMLDSKGKEMSKRKTAVCRGQPNPTYKETFVFQVALFQLSEVSLVVSVFCRRSSMRPRERLGWVSLGHSSTTEEQQSHWTEMREAEGQQVCHWHTLTDT
ncbi:synaptotagmin-14-like isoform X1 [Poecilia reticulata]|uniref:synaptotagmin-14-like isoform X1 n=1 Tax=Poecilia reticulata TaxID=8081 RepID=UPI0004A2FB6F|nr:PREDICTED: synaptotagmin-14-like isoform X1 [Poecilia reticulata]